MNGEAVPMERMTGHHNFAAKIILIGIVLNIASCFFLIPKLGILRGTIATLGTITFWNVGMYLYVRKNLRIDSTILGLIFRIFRKEGDSPHLAC